MNRPEILRRARTWTSIRVPYSQTGWYRGYRRDCSGFISMAWGLNASYVTWTLPKIARPIGKNDLQPGDILLNASSGSDGHAVLFGGWANPQRTAYIALEQNGETDNAVERVMAYPYKSRPERYKPYRWTGVQYVSPKGPRQTYDVLPGWKPTDPSPGTVVPPAPKPAAQPAVKPAVDEHAVKVGVIEALSPMHLFAPKLPAIPVKPAQPTVMPVVAKAAPAPAAVPAKPAASQPATRAAELVKPRPGMASTEVSASPYDVAVIQAPLKRAGRPKRFTADSDSVSPFVKVIEVIVESAVH